LNAKDDTVAAGPIFSRRKRAPYFGRRAEQREKIGGDGAARQMRRLSLSGEVAPLVGQVGRHFYRPAPLLHGHDARLGIRLRNLDEPVRLGVRKGPDERAVDEAEHRGVAADPQRKRKRSHNGQAGMLAQHPKAVAEVLP